MTDTRLRNKSSDKPDHFSGMGRQKRQEEAIDFMVRGLDALMAYAEEANMGTAARIFYTAKEELVHWAVNMNFHESPQEQFINRRLYENRLAAIEGLIVRAIKSTATREEMLRLLDPPPLKPRH